MDPNNYQNDPAFVLPTEGEKYTKKKPKHTEDAYQGYLSALLVYLEDKYEESENIFVTPFSSGRSGFPRDVAVFHPTHSIGDEIRILTEETHAARIVDIATSGGGASQNLSSEQRDTVREGDYITIYLQPQVPDELYENVTARDGTEVRE